MRLHPESALRKNVNLQLRAKFAPVSNLSNWDAPHGFRPLMSILYPSIDLIEALGTGIPGQYP